MLAPSTSCVRASVMVCIAVDVPLVERFADPTTAESVSKAARDRSVAEAVTFAASLSYT